MKRYQPHLLVLCILAAIALSGPHEAFRNTLTDMRFPWSPREASGNVVIVAIDSSSMDEIGVWPWPRTIHAQLIKRLQKAGTADTVFDVDFSSASTPAGDQALEDALREADGSVVLLSFKQAIDDGRNGIAIHTNRPLPQFAKHAWSAGANVIPDNDGLVRHYPLRVLLDGKILPSVAALMAGASSTDASDVRVDFGIRLQSIPTVSYIDVLRGDPGILAKLKDKKIIVGATAVELGDRFNVPNGRIISGVQLQALATETLLQGRDLRIVSTAVTFAGLCIILLLMFTTWRRVGPGVRIGLLIGLSVAIETGATLLQAALPLMLNTLYLQAAIALYALVTALDEIELRGFLGRMADRRFHRVATLLSDGLACVDQSGTITVWNDGAVAIWGYSAEEMIGRPFQRIVASEAPDDSASSPSPNWPRDIGQVRLGEVMEFHGRRKNGESFPAEACFSAWQGADGPQYAAILRDISRRKLELEKIRYLAEYDTLTGLANRNMLEAVLSSMIEKAKTDSGQIAFLLLGLDRFKEVNDTMGHACGDQLLFAVADQLKDVAGEAALVARMSGDEFAILLTGRDVAQTSETLAERIVNAFSARTFFVAGRELQVKCSVGVACFPKDCATVEELLGNADLAMCRAKSSGRGKYVLYDHAIRREVETRVQLVAELDKAPASNEFELFYQPQFSLRDGKLVGAEALIRWRHPQRGLILPGAFMPVVNTTAIANTVARWVLRTACMQGRAWHQLGHAIRIGVNLAPSQFQSGDLAGEVAAILAETGFLPALLELEVTENILLEDDEKAVGTFRRMGELGINVALDDFGTGYASLNYLKKFPLNRLKIDQLFVRGLQPHSNDAAIVEYTLNLSKLLGLSVIAEGIENQSTVDLLVGMGCEEGQGYHLGRPVPVAEFEQRFLLGNALQAPPVGQPTANAA